MKDLPIPNTIRYAGFTHTYWNATDEVCGLEPRLVLHTSGCGCCEESREITPERLDEYIADLTETLKFVKQLRKEYDKATT